MIRPPKVGRGIEGNPPDMLKALVCHHHYHYYCQGGSMCPCHFLIRRALMLFCWLSMAFLCSVNIVFWAWGRVSPTCCSVSRVSFLIVPVVPSVTCDTSPCARLPSAA